MKKLLFSAFLATAAESAFATAAIEQVIVRQQWPWSTDVKVEYKITGIVPETPVNLQVEAFNGGVPLDQTKLRSSITGDLYGISTDGIGQFIIDPVKAFGQEQVALANFKVKLTLVDAPEMKEALYKIFDLTATVDPEKGQYFPVTDVTRGDLLNGKFGTIETDYSKLGDGFVKPDEGVLIWTDVTNYPGAKTTKFIVRKINAKGKTWQMGADDSNVYWSFAGQTNAKKAHDVTLTEDYYISVFPVTLAQYQRLSGGNWYGNNNKLETAPVENASHSVFRGIVTGNMAQRLNLAVDYPTEAQWEYACRAGVNAELYTGKHLSSADLAPIAWFGGDYGNADGKSHEVGLKLPNAFGLYDMIGNVCEATCDWYSESEKGYGDGTAVTNPTGPATGTAHVYRGGSYTVGNIFCTCPGRRSNESAGGEYGFRIAFTVAD